MRPVRALIIEDEPQIQKLIARCLRRTFDTPDFIVVNNADAAIRELKDSLFDGYFDVIISDYNLVGPKTGGDIVAWIKEQDEPRWLDRFMFFSGTTDVDLEALHHQVLRKPATLAELRNRIINLTRS